MFHVHAYTHSWRPRAGRYMIDQLLLVVGLIHPLVVVTPAEGVQRVVADHRPNIVGGIVIIVSPKDLFHSDDAYTKAMARLVAEQKQMTWIEHHVQKIEDDWTKADKEIEKGMVSVINGAVKNAEAGGGAQSVLLDMKAKLDAREKRNNESRERRLEPWSQKYAKQLERIDKAREAVDAVTPN
jgi:hypothetical protein